VAKHHPHEVRSHEDARRPAPKDEPNLSTPKPEARPALLLWLAAAAVTFWSFGFTTMKGSDLWWHIASGRWIWQHKTLNFKDPWSFTFGGKAWLSHEWLSDVIFHGWSSLLGMESLVWWKWLVLVSTFVLLFLTLKRLAGSALPAYLAALSAIAVGAAFFDVRPQLYSLFGFVALLRLALLPSRHRWLLPVGFFFWVNLHGGFFFGLLVLTTIFAVARVAGEAKKNDLPLWLICLVVCLLNPNGPDAYVFSLHYATNPRSAYLRIGEWKPLWEEGGIRDALYFPAVGAFVVASVLTFVAGLHRKQPRPTYTALGLGLLTLAMSLKSRRFIPLFGIAQSLVLAPVLSVGVERARLFVARKWPQLTERLWPKLVLPAAAFILGLLWLLPYPLSSRAFLYLTSQDGFPVEAMNVAEVNQLQGKVFAYYEWGGYVDLRTDGRLQVFIDGRADTVFDDQTYRRYSRVHNAHPGWEKVVDDSGADYFLWPRQHHKQAEALRESGKWRTLYADHVAVLLIRADLPGPSPLQPSPDSPWRDLTLGWRASAARDWTSAKTYFQHALDKKPNLRAACEWLANAQSHSDGLEAAQATLDRCQRLFPDRARRQELLAHFQSRSDATP
jgi:hypothetical protein